MLPEFFSLQRVNWHCIHGHQRFIFLQFNHQHPSISPLDRPVCVGCDLPLGIDQSVQTHAHLAYQRKKTDVERAAKQKKGADYHQRRQVQKSRLCDHVASKLRHTTGRPSGALPGFQTVEQWAKIQDQQLWRNRRFSDVAGTRLRSNLPNWIEPVLWSCSVFEKSLQAKCGDQGSFREKICKPDH